MGIRDKTRETLWVCWTPNCKMFGIEVWSVNRCKCPECKVRMDAV